MSDVEKKKPFLETYNLAVGYEGGQTGNGVLIRDLNLSLYPGQLTCLLGRNGIGKSTLIRTLSYLQNPIEGKVLWKEKEPEALSIRQRAREVGVVLTQLEQTGSMTVRELVCLGRYPYTDWFGTMKSLDEEAVSRAMEQTGCLEIANRILSTLSDGEKQRALIARVLAQETDILFLDEPTAFLDLPGRAQILLLLRRIAKERKITILMSTHDFSLALEAADIFWVLDDEHNFHQGAPEDLILRGVLRDVFSKDGISIDEETANIRLKTEQTGVVQYRGKEDLRTQWVKHALRRQGYGVQEKSEIVIEEKDEGWQIIGLGAVRFCEKVQDIVEVLNSAKNQEEKE